MWYSDKWGAPGVTVSRLPSSLYADRFFLITHFGLSSLLMPVCSSGLILQSQQPSGLIDDKGNDPGHRQLKQRRSQHPLGASGLSFTVASVAIHGMYSRLKVIIQ